MSQSSLKRLEKLWYGKLRRSGFEDIEIGDEYRTLKTWHSHRFYNEFHPIEIQAIKDYYERAEEVLRQYEFPNPHQKKIWVLHMEGLPVREIAKQVTRYKKSMINYIIVQIEQMFMRDE